MNRNKRGVMPEINRKIYKDVKAYDRQQLASFCGDIYKFGFEDGYEAAKKDEAGAIELDEIIATLSEVKGVGAKTFENIKAAVTAKFGGDSNAKEKGAGA